jgi:hypothetical protein
VLSAQIAGAADHSQRMRRRQAHRDHIGLDELAEPDAGVKPFGSDIDQIRACGDLHLDLGIGLAERRDERLQQVRHHRPRRGEPQQPGRPLPRSRATSLAATSSSNAGFARKRNRSPASVNPTLRVVRMKSVAPTRASRARTAWLIAEGVTPSSADALRKLRCCATLRNASTPSSAPCRTVKFCFIAHQCYHE